MVEAKTAGPERDLVVATKMAVPRLRPGRVERPRLLERLRATAGREVVLVCAPAGFGKSSLLAEWVRADGRPAAWLSLDDADNDPVRFWRHVAAAVDGVRPGLAGRAGLLVGGPTPESVMPAVTALINDMARAAEDVLLVVDDYHVIHASDVHRSVEFLLEHLPSSLRLVVASRSDPPLPLARLRARGQLAELRAADLWFTLDETTRMLAAATAQDLPEELVGVLGERTEGWAAGPQLAALSLRGRRDVARFVEEFSGSHRYVLDHLTEEVLDRQPDDVRSLRDRARRTRCCARWPATTSPRRRGWPGGWTRRSGRWPRSSRSGRRPTSGSSCSGSVSTSGSSSRTAAGWARRCAPTARSKPARTPPRRSRSRACRSWASPRCSTSVTSWPRRPAW